MKQNKTIYSEHMRLDKVAKNISNYQTSNILTEAKNVSRAKENIKKYGTSPEKMEQGKNDRLAGLSLEGNKYDIEDIKNEGELISYEYGYKDQANRMLMIGILNKKYTSQSLMMIGYNDARDSHIIFNDLPETIRNCLEYLEGYRRGLEEEQVKEKHR
ncbi:MAG: hypothetical protein ACI4U4_01800 [Bacilli bacterium]